eukprot:15436029-Alexandrium_andersonii.AAC.1
MEDTCARRIGHAPARATSTPRPERSASPFAPPPPLVRGLRSAARSPDRSTLFRAQGVRAGVRRRGPAWP